MWKTAFAASQRPFEIQVRIQGIMATGLPNSGSVGTMPAGMYRCCEAMDVEYTGECSDGCCSRYRCKACGKRVTYEWPD